MGRAFAHLSPPLDLPLEPAPNNIEPNNGYYGIHVVGGTYVEYVDIPAKRTTYSWSVMVLMLPKSTAIEASLPALLLSTPLHLVSSNIFSYLIIVINFIYHSEKSY